MFTNFRDDRHRAWLPLENIGIPVNVGKGLRILNAFTGEDDGVVKESMFVELEPHDCAVYIAEICDA